MTLDELEKLADESPLIATMATQHLKQLISLCRLQHEALRFAADEIKPVATEPYEREGDCFCPVCTALDAYEEFGK